MLAEFLNNDTVVLNGHVFIVCINYASLTVLGVHLGIEKRMQCDIHELSIKACHTAVPVARPFVLNLTGKRPMSTYHHQRNYNITA